MEFGKVDAACLRLHRQTGPGNAVPAGQRIFRTAQAHGEIADSPVRSDTLGKEVQQLYGAAGARLAAADPGLQDIGEIGGEPGQGERLQGEGDIPGAVACMQCTREVDTGRVIDLK